MRGYLLFEDVFLVNQIDVVEHCLIVDAGQSSDDLHEKVVMRIGLGAIVIEEFQDVSIQIKSIL